MKFSKFIVVLLLSNGSVWAKPSTKASLDSAVETERLAGVARVNDAPASEYPKLLKNLVSLTAYIEVARATYPPLVVNKPFIKLSAVALADTMQADCAEVSKHVGPSLIALAKWEQWKNTESKAPWEDHLRKDLFCHQPDRLKAQTTKLKQRLLAMDHKAIDMDDSGLFASLPIKGEPRLLRRYDLGWRFSEKEAAQLVLADDRFLAMLGALKKRLKSKLPQHELR